MDRRKGERRQADRCRASARVTVTPAQSRSAAVETAEAFLRRDRPLHPQPRTLDDTRERLAPASRPEVSGPSFLGLTASAPGSGDYLLEDEPRSHWRAWAVLLLLVLLGVLAYMQWKTNWRAQPPSPPPMAPAQSAPQGSAAPASEATGVPAQQAASLSDPFFQVARGEGSATTEKDKPPGPGAGESPPGNRDSAGGQSSQPPADKREHKPTPHARNKPAAERSSTPSDPHQDPMVLMAQRYLYGQGVRRDCDQAMVYLRAANQKASAAARSQMGALYATGYCVPLDRVRAYQWFTSALNVEPENPALQRERNNLWSQMSSDERQQAVK